MSELQMAETPTCKKEQMSKQMYKQMFNIKVLNTKLPDSNTRLINAMN